MGTLFVDKLDPQSGTALEIGSSGDTMTVPSGATLSIAGTINASSGTATGFAPTGITSAMTSGTGLSIDSSGRITTPLQPMFQAYASADQAISNWADNDVTFGGEDFDVGSNFASSTFTAPVTGKYIFFVRLQINNVGSWAKVKLIPTGKQYQWFLNPATASVMCDFSQIVSMAASDTCKVTIVADDNSYTVIGASGSTYHQTTFSGYLLG